jgi:hypothetical protein
VPDINHDAPNHQPPTIRDEQSTPNEPPPPADRAASPERTPVRAPRGGNKSFALLTSGLSLYLIVLWFGVTVVGDTMLRSALMAALIVTIAGTGFVHSRRSVAPEE